MKIYTDIMIDRIIELEILSSNQINEKMKIKINNLTEDLINTYNNSENIDMYPPMILKTECETNVKNINDEMKNDRLYYEDTIKYLKGNISDLQDYIWILEKEIMKES